jgi:hypothetical protein
VAGTSVDTIDASTVSIAVSVTNARAVQSKSPFALVDVEIEIAGVTFGIRGVQARRHSDGGTSVNLPTVRDLDGVWRPAICLPDEVCAPLADAVLVFLGPGAK